MRGVAICLSYLIIHFTSFGQNAPYKFSRQIDSSFLASEFPWKYQVAAWEYSFIGEQIKADQAWDIDLALEAYSPLTAQQKENFKKYKPVPAKDFILTKAAKSRIIILNEAHHKPEHRIFLLSLLPELKRLGFNTLALEVLSHKDSLLNSRGYPVLTTGVYAKEPCFGNLIRKGLELDFKLTAYEATMGKNNREREIEQAENIKSILDKNPASKLILYVGFDHAIEDSLDNSWGLAMAGRIKNITGIDPLTIDQVELTGTSTPKFDNPYRQLIKTKYSSIFVDEMGNPFNKANEKKGYDVNVFHPNLNYQKGRPEWISAHNLISENITKKITISFPCLVMAYLKPEDIRTAVPVDVMELKNNQDSKSLMLNKNSEYTVLIENEKGEKQTLEIKTN